MALKGTLKDFGIADILQLIGQQQKTGTLFLKAKEQEVAIGFKDGSIVKAESTTRNKKELIGAMLVRAEIVNGAQLETALDAQRRSLKRLGDVLVSLKMLTHERFMEMVQLQATETLYRLFTWKNGTYEFEQGAVEVEGEATIKPLRAESVLMEGFRMVDEWPVIKRTIGRYDITFRKLRDLPLPRMEKDAFDDALAGAFSEKKKDESQGEFKSVGDNERRVFDQVVPGRDVRKLVDVSCVGEFETCKALCNLVNLEYLEALSPEGKAAPIDRGEPLWQKAASALGRVAVTMLVLAAFAAVLSRVDLDSVSLTRSPSSSFADPAAQRFVSRAQLSRIQAAIDVYRLENARLPETLDALVQAGLLAKEDVRYPWREPYYYRPVSEGEFVLLPPLR